MANPILWYVTLGGREQGPYEPAAVRLLVDQGQITATTLVRRSDLSAPVPAGEIKGLLKPATVAVHRPTSVHLSREASKSTTAAFVRPPDPRLQQDEDAGTAAAEDAAPETSEDHGNVDPAEGLHAPIGQRVASGLIDLVLIGGLIGALATVAVMKASGARDQAIAQVDASREGKWTSFEAWPAEAAKAKEQMAASEKKMQEVAPTRGSMETTYKPTEAETEARRVHGNFKIDFDYHKALVDSGDKQYARDEARIAAEVAKAGRSALVMMIGALFLGLVIHPLCEGLVGGSPGKLAFGLRVVGPGRRPAGPGRAILRHLVRCIPFEPLSIFAGGQALHDRWSGTTVIAAADIEQSRPGHHGKPGTRSVRRTTGSISRPRPRVRR